MLRSSNKRYTMLRLADALLRILGLAIGLFGVFILSFFLWYVYELALESSSQSKLNVILLIFGVVGVYFLRVAYQVLVKGLSQSAIKHVCAIVSVIIALKVPLLLKMAIPIDSSRQVDALVRVAAALGGFFIYRLLSRGVIAWRLGQTQEGNLPRSTARDEG